MLRLGIDNGKDGAIVGIAGDYTVPVQERMPWLKKEGMDMRLVQEILESALLIHGRAYAVLEHAQSFPGMGVAGAFNYGAGYGTMKGLLAALHIPYEIVRPQAWQKAQGITTSAKGKDARRAALKAQSIATAQRRLPDLDLTPGRIRKPHDGLADAANMALHAARLRPFPAAPPPPPRRP